jgi:hypothetical protein
VKKPSLNEISVNDKSKSNEEVRIGNECRTCDKEVVFREFNGSGVLCDFCQGKTCDFQFTCCGKTVDYCSVCYSFLFVRRMVEDKTILHS